MILLIVGAILGIALTLTFVYIFVRRGFNEGTKSELVAISAVGGVLGFIVLGLLPQAFLDYDEYSSTSTTYPIKSVAVGTDRWSGTKGRTYSEDNLKLFYKTGGTWRPHTIPFDERYIKWIESNESPTMTVIKEVPSDTFYNNWVVLTGTKEKYRYIIKGTL